MNELELLRIVKRLLKDKNPNILGSRVFTIFRKGGGRLLDYKPYGIGREIIFMIMCKKHVGGSIYELEINLFISPTEMISVESREVNILKIDKYLDVVISLYNRGIIKIFGKFNNTEITIITINPDVGLDINSAIVNRGRFNGRGVTMMNIDKRLDVLHNAIYSIHKEFGND